jgi:c-di-GMP-related signal transduction protein
MDVFVGRQPILDRNLRTYAYELLFRSGTNNCCEDGDAAWATDTVISNTFLSIGADRILGTCKGFINFPQELLVAGAAEILPRDTVVIEILETVAPDEEVIRACRGLKEKGYLLALDDFVKQANGGPLVELADFIKVDFRATSPEDRNALAKEYGGHGIRMLAEKVENEDEFHGARGMGYCYFQGFFFARPQIISARDIPVGKLNHLRILRELQRPELDFERLEEFVRLDVSLAHKLLRYVNSAAFAWKWRIESMRHAFAVLGEESIRRWIAMTAIPRLASHKPPELTRISLTRARMCEQIATQAGLAHRSSDGFLMGLFSLLDAMIGRPLGELLTELGLAADVCAALADTGMPENVMRKVYELCLACEAADPCRLQESCSALGLSLGLVSQLALNATVWSQSVCKEVGV